MSFLRTVCFWRNKNSPKHPPSTFANLPDNIKVNVRVDGKKETGTYRGVSPSGIYVVRLDKDNTIAFFLDIELL